MPTVSRASCWPGSGSVSVSFAPVRHCPPPVARPSSGQVKGGDGCLQMPASRLGKRVGATRGSMNWGLRGVQDARRDVFGRCREDGV
jgi:hypothetical protein